MLLGLAALCLLVGLLVWWRPLTLSLTPGGLTVRTAFRTHRVAWDEITGPVTGKGRLLDLGGGRRMRFAVGSLKTDPWYLAQGQRGVYGR